MHYTSTPRRHKAKKAKHYQTEAFKVEKRIRESDKNSFTRRTDPVEWQT